MKRYAFTLLEVLVAISIVAVLAALTFSVGATALRRSKETVCISNLKQLHSAMSLYQADFDEYPPMSDTWPGLMPYLGNHQLTCPVARTAHPLDTERLVVNYFVHGFIPRYMLGMEEDRNCMQLRGPTFPIAHDSNHIYAPVAYQTGRALYIVLRLDGSVQVRQKREMDRFEIVPGEFPCPSAHWWSNL